MKIILSGVKPTGIPTLGNYLGALRNFGKFQEKMKDYEFFIFVADLHAITTPQDPLELKQNIRNVAALYLACGLKPENLTLFIQSEVHEHAEMAYIMQALVYMGELERMTQYKDKVLKQTQGVSSALFTYPALMAADILLYDAKFVPVGDDQRQHLELARDLAIRFNNRFGKTFTVPEGLIQEKGARIKDLQDPTKKMDKSTDNDRGCIFLLEPLSQIRKKIKAAVTDSDACVRFDPEQKPGIANLMTIYSVITEKSFGEIEAMYDGKGYGDFKSDLAEIVVKEIAMIQERYHYFVSSQELTTLLDEGRLRAHQLAQKKLKTVYQKMGLGR
ncbi:MAG TPA: tryptophan--tRNA ligase [Bacilli bacterium]|nr:MAG: Tryptophan--tRNA ligase [Tenericutes bacterium ADurb.BinA124]HNZ49999.1 tryptophan--tRNA ligase [Bacilli bacterium]HOH18262.1 tryptophan--tRNA ligase [Bacilli bacterium]HPN60847.1 tryptophan--tRNA ligase [Bacilli bacterium]HPX84359.1 tryptophan--tRNA ligase [Bacilli bacterium]